MTVGQLTMSGTTKHFGTTSAFKVETVSLSPDRLHANGYNPNRMGEDAWAEFVAEVCHLGRLPKTIVVRSKGAEYLIVDGEHAWRAAKEIGLALVSCEVIAADDFEARRQTHKRNRHGTDNPVRLGRMFRQMLEARSLSQRALAKEIEVSEGTIRNALFYAEAAVLRSRYAKAQGEDSDEGDADGDVTRLSVQQVRRYVKLPRAIADLWLNTGASVRALWQGLGAGVKTDADVAEIEREASYPDLYARYQRLEDSDLTPNKRARCSPPVAVQPVHYDSLRPKSASRPSSARSKSPSRLTSCP